jgi:hypothetical protein
VKLDDTVPTEPASRARRRIAVNLTDDSVFFTKEISVQQSPEEEWRELIDKITEIVSDPEGKFSFEDEHGILVVAARNVHHLLFETSDDSGHF